MSSIKTTTWKLKPHTRAKHLILKSYLNAWLPILTSWNKRVIYIDGFAGPGEYIGGEDGSPIIAIKSVMNHKIKFKSEIVMIFIEAVPKRCKFLENKISSINLPLNLKVQCVCKKFSEALTEIFKYLDEQKERIAPSFIFIDPFGFKGIPFYIIKRIMENSKCEVFITFMYDDINRFMKNENLWRILDETFGTKEWKSALDIKIPLKRINLLYSIYRKQLEKVAKYIIAFKIIDKTNRLDYFLFFGTNHVEGLKAMKHAMWRADPTGNFQFSDYTYYPDQGFLIEPEPSFNILKTTLLKEFKGRTVTVKNLEDFIILKTPFLKTHYRRVLIPLQDTNPPQIEVITDERRRKNWFKTYYKIKFH